MDGQAIMTVSAAVVALVQLAKWAGLHDSKGPLGVLVLSLLGVAFWAWSSNDFTRASGFAYFAGWIAVMTSAAGVFGFTRASGANMVKFSGTGDGGKLPAFLLAIALSGVTLSGCAGTMPRIQPLPAEVAVADRHVSAVVGNLQQLLTMTSAVADTVSQIEDDASKAGAIPPAADAVFDKAAIAYADASSRASKALVTGGVKTWPELKALVQPVLERGQVLIDTAWNIKALKSKASGFLRALRDGLMELVGQVILAGGLGGAR